MEPPPEPVSGAGWRVNVERWSYELLGLYRRHPWALHVPIGPTPPIGPGQLAWLDRCLGCFAGTPLQPWERIAVALLLVTYVRGEAVFALDINRMHPVADQPPYGELLGRVVDPSRLPALAELVEMGIFEGAEVDAGAQLDEQVAFGLGRLLDGIEMMMSASQSSAATP